MTSSDWLDELEPLDWKDLRGAHRRTRAILSRLAADKDLLTQRVRSIELDADRLKASEVHPLINRLILHQSDPQGFHIRLHMSPGSRDLVPHDHKYSFSAYVLRGGYIHVWRRRSDDGDGEFLSHQVSAAIASVEREGSCYTFGHPLIHQTAMLPGTVSLFIRGPREKVRSHAALDLLPQADSWGAPAEAGKPKHANGQRPITLEELRQMRSQLEELAVIHAA
ncbi:hypothetical protein [Nonomuraea sp. NPDC049129]|uniref:hypothetical protein n=1 Tax=Nonomuraea sp. NPDC049129 TaxID=3155272 RepID=UPI0033EBCBBF